MPVAHRREERSNLLGCERVRLLLGVRDVCAGIEPLHLDEGVLLQPELVDRLGTTFGFTVPRPTNLAPQGHWVRLFPRISVDHLEQTFQDDRFGQYSPQAMLDSEIRDGSLGGYHHDWNS